LISSPPRNGVRRRFAQPLDALGPKAIAEPGGEPLRRHQPRDQKRGENPFTTRGGALAGQELFNFVGDAIHVAGPDRMIAPGKLDQPCASDPLGEIAPARDCDPRIIGSMKDQGGDVNSREHIADVDLCVHAAEPNCGRRTDRQPFEARPPRLEAGVFESAGSEMTKCRATPP
jgi:hypothetical protein